MLIIFDFNRTLYDPDTHTLVPCARFVLRNLRRRGHRMFLLSRKEHGRRSAFRALGLGRYFSGSAFVRSKTQAVLNDIMRKNKSLPSETVVVGDYVKEEIACGNAVGAKTVWLRRGKFAYVIPSTPREKPTHTVQDIQGILEIIR